MHMHHMQIGSNSCGVIDLVSGTFLLAYSPTYVILAYLLTKGTTTPSTTLRWSDSTAPSEATHTNIYNTIGLHHTGGGGRRTRPQAAAF